MTSSVVSIAPGASLADALALMAGMKVSSLVVAESKVPSGLILESGILESVIKGADPATTLVSAIATPAALRLGIGDSVLDAVLALERAHASTALVVANDGTLAGILSITDILRKVEDDHFITRQKVKHSMGRTITLVGEMEPLDSCIRKMVQEKSDSVIITAKGEGVGIFSRRDAVRAVSESQGGAGKAAILSEPVYRHMTSPLITVNGEATLYDACALMERMAIRRVIVVDSKNQPRGLLHQRDLLRRLDANYTEILRRAIAQFGSKTSFSEHRYKAIVESSVEAICVISGDRFHYANERAAAVFGFERGYMEGLALSSVVQTEDLAMVRAELDACASEPETARPFRFRGRRLDGSEAMVEIALQYIPEQDEGVFAGTLRDVTEDKRRAVEETRKQLLMTVINAVSVPRAGAEGMDAPFKDACAAIVRGFPLDAAAIMMADGGRLTLAAFAARSGIGEDVRTSAPHLVFGPQDQLPAAEAAARGKPLFLARGGTLYDEAALGRLFGSAPRYLLFVPMKVEGRTAGVLAVGVEREQALLAADAGIYLETLAGQLARAYESWRLQRSLRDSQAQLRELFESAVDVVFKVNRAGLIEELNPRFSAVFGLDPALWTGHPFVELLNSPSHESGMLDRQQRFSEAEFELKTAAGPRPFLISAWPRSDGDGKVIGTWRVARDLSSQKEKEGELVALKEKAEEANRAKGTFLSNMSHELRTPLTAILGFSNLITQHTGLPADVAEHAGIITHQAKGLLTLINNLLELVESERSAPLRLRETSLSDLLASCVLRESEHAREREVAVFTELSPAVPARVMADEDKISLVLDQLIGNAVKFTHKGEVRIQVDAGDRQLVFTVRDNGIGIPPDRLQAIFEAFEQADSSLTRRYGGMGLGLALAKAMVRALGGAIRVESAPGAGTLFQFTVPLVPAEEEPSPLARILVADDDEASRHLLRDILGKAGYQAVMAADGTAAVNRCRRERFSMLIMNVVMPEKSGIEAIAEIRALPGYAGIPALAVTGLAMDGDRTRIRKAGFSDYLAKPFAPLDLLSCVERVLGAPAPTGKPAD